MPVLLTAIRHRYRSVLALDDVNLHVRRGDCYGFIGHNGAGKTTALRIALGLVRPQRGRATIGGHDAQNPRVRAWIGGLIETPGFHDHRSGARNLGLLAALQGIPRDARRGEVDRVLALVGLADAGTKRVGHYSHGMRQRLGLGAALLGQPRYLLLDEPTNGLDPQGIHELRVLLSDLSTGTGVTILLSSHLLAEVADLCDRVGVLHRGALLVEAPTAELLAEARSSYVLATDDDAAAAAVLAGRGVATSPAPGGGLALSLDTTPPADIVAALVHAGREVHSFASRPASLESIYLEYTRGDRNARAAAAAAAPAATPAAAGAATSAPATAAAEPLPGAPTAPGRVAAATARIAGYELRRLLRPGTLFALAIPALVAPLVIYQRARGLAIDAAEVAGGTLHSATGVTAFEALGRALGATLPLLALVVAGLASQSLAGELRAGTLRNVLIRPFHRAEVALGKLAILLAATLAAYLALVAAAAGAAGWAFDYGDLVELLATGVRYEHLTAADVWPELWPALASPIVPLLAFAALGFLCSSIARSAAGALALTLGTITFLELGRGLARAFHFEGMLLGPYLPSPLTRRSHIDYFIDVAGGVSREDWPLAAAVPAVWLLACGVFAALVFRRRYVP